MCGSEQKADSYGKDTRKQTCLSFLQGFAFASLHDPELGIENLDNIGCGGRRTAVWWSLRSRMALRTLRSPTLSNALSPALCPSRRAVVAPTLGPRMLLGLQPGPLVGGQDAAQTQQHFGVGFFEVGAQVGNL